MFEILKKTASQYISNSLNCKTESAQIIAVERLTASINKISKKNLKDKIEQNINKFSTKETGYFTTLELQSACSQFNLDPETLLHCRLAILTGESTDTYNRF